MRTHCGWKYQLLAVAGFVAAAQLPAVAAEPSYEAVRVDTAGLDLRSPAGAAMLAHRVRAAAVKVCDAVSSTAAMQSDIVSGCVQQAVRDAAPRVQALVAAARATRTYAVAAPRS